MGDILTYAQTYQEQSFKEQPFNIVDSLILCQLAYYKYEGSSFEKIFFDKKLCDFYRNNTPDRIILKGMLTREGDEKMIPLLSTGGRHGDVRACRYVEKLSVEEEIQFAAITFEISKGEYFIAIRGTDASVVGWKEDFALSFQTEIPAQKAAFEYVYETMLALPGKFYIGGHSKGGNLAVYAAMNLPENVQKRVKAVYSFDGPGFLKEVYEQANYRTIHHAVHKIIPRSSVVGMILEEWAEHKVVQSCRELYMQHNPYTWQVEGTDFLYMEGEDAFSKMVKRTFDGWLEELDWNERSKIIGTVFRVIEETGITSFYELTEQKVDKIKRILDGAAQIEPQERKRIHLAVKRLLTIAKEELKFVARTERMIQIEKGVVQLEKYTAKIEKLIQSIPRVDK